MLRLTANYCQKGYPMKLSLRWIFDHIEGQWNQHSVETIAQKITAMTAELDGFEPYTLDLSDYSLVEVTALENDGVCAKSSEWSDEYQLEMRNDAIIGSYYLVKKEGTSVRWATVADWSCPKEGLLPAMACDASMESGAWKQIIETDDYILDVDNKAINNRPDLWGHRGFAREVAALFSYTLKTEEQFLADVAEKTAEASFSFESGPTISIKDTQACSRFSACTASTEHTVASSLWMASRLTRVGLRAIDLYVDATNYTMADWGHPMHAYDADALQGKTVTARLAQKNETVTLLDQQEYELTQKDCIIADEKGPVALAGIMGSAHSGVQPTTKKFLLEAACFDATMVRVSAAHHKIRTDASARFEKTLDPHQTTKALQRFIALVQKEDARFVCQGPIASVGTAPVPPVVTFTHEYLEKRSGVTLDTQFVQDSLTALAFDVSYKNNTYSVGVPSFRATKDIKDADDVLEEIIRLFGYANIPLSLPLFEKQSESLHGVHARRYIKRFLAFSAGMQEVENYALFDNDFLQLIGWKKDTTISVELKNALSEQRTTLVSSLIPHLLQTVHENMANNDSLRFFEWARDWSLQTDKVVEGNRLAGIFYHKKAVDFYTVKESLQELFNTVRIDVEWKQVEEVPQWAHRYKTAALYVDDLLLGYVGTVTQKIMRTLGVGESVVFELDATLLLQQSQERACFKPLSKYQPLSFDISMMVEKNVTVARLQSILSSIDDRIASVTLQDVFEKAEWQNEKSITMRLHVVDFDKTISKEEKELLHAKALAALEKQGVAVR